MSISIEKLKGVGKKRCEQLQKLGITTVDELLFFFPRDYIDRTIIHPIGELLYGQTACIKAKLSSNVKEIRTNNRMTIYEAKISDDTGSLKAIWFNQSFVKFKLKRGEEYIFFGKLEEGKNKVIRNPSFESCGELVDNFIKILPIYPSTKGLGQTTLRKLTKLSLDEHLRNKSTSIPQEIVDKYNLSDYKHAIYNTHFPNEVKTLAESKERLLFEELFKFNIKLLNLKDRVLKQEKTRVYPQIEQQIQDFIHSLPFELTNAQNNAIKEVFADMDSKKIMNRMVQGDVGSGKTIIAALSIFKCAKSGYQSLFLAPTSVLAEQHFNELTKLFKNFNISICLLTGSLTKKQKTLLKQDIQEGKIDVVVGTHAIIQEDVYFKNLSLSITDEQHRFGVRQRELAVAKGNQTDVLVMSATPIPRSLALILFADLDISIIDEMPKGRLPVDTYIVSEDKRQRLINFIKQNIDQGGQGFIVCPLVEDSEKLDSLTSAKSLWENYSTKDFKGYRVDLLHGKMKPEEKEQVIHNFSTGYTQLLLSTTVIEVGVNVPNANIMVVENAERFGLSQLHQLRGRVGRGMRKSYAILFNQSESLQSYERLKILQESNDGFFISEKDLETRGPGDFFGRRQHGIPELNITSLSKNSKILKNVQLACQELSDSGKLDTLTDTSFIEHPGI